MYRFRKTFVRNLLLGFFAIAIPSVDAQEAEQTLNLVSGWNAVWLEVTPVHPAGSPQAGQSMAPGDVFPSAVTRVISPKPLAGLAEFFADAPQSVSNFNQNDWEQWQNPSVVGTDNLAFVTGNRPYLIRAQSNLNLTIKGRVRFHRPVWNPDRYNLVGFGLDSTPNFQNFFGPSKGKHPVNRIYRLVPSSGNWVKVGGGDSMSSNQAYWVFCSGNSDYMGPVAVDFDQAISGKLSFGGPGDAVSVDQGSDEKSLDLEEIVFTNLSSSTATPELELVTNQAPDAGAIADLELYAVSPMPGSFSYQTVARVDSTPDDESSSDLQEVVATQASSVLTLGARRNWSDGLVGRTHLYRLKTGGGTEFWLPISAGSNNLQLPSEPLPTGTGSVAGLWVGEVIIDQSTSIVEDGEPLRATAGSAPLRILLHSDGSGAVKLLSQVTLMQTRSADPDVAAEPVLVIDQARIPFFEGIKERNGKRVGIRLDAVAFDMPRKLDATSQGALLNDPAYPQLGGPEDIADFLISRATRPPSLAEVYELSWGLAGSLAAGQSVSTAAPLVLDPFHRTNPFRHAFHQRHPKGPNVVRDIEIIFDSAQAIPGVLQGSYQETLRGLTKTNLVSSGRLELRRVSSVNALQ